MASLNTGSQLGPYQIIESIGAGGMGEVYTAVCVQKQSFPLSFFVSRTPSSIGNSLRRLKWFSSCDDTATKDWVLPLRMCPRDGRTSGLASFQPMCFGRR